MTSNILRRIKRGGYRVISARLLTVHITDNAEDQLAMDRMMRNGFPYMELFALKTMVENQMAGIE